MPKDLLKEKISVARGLIKAAEEELDVALRSVEARPRAEKTTISQVVEEALTRLRSAKESLQTLPLPDKDEEGPGA
ncbi:MAG TPA: hypothetical protein VFS00_08940 [Polyangiaceae bacterium]|nr:hypothetical protein [Polyangiaceae bacterium]